MNFLFIFLNSLKAYIIVLETMHFFFKKYMYGLEDLNYNHISFYFLISIY